MKLTSVLAAAGVSTLLVSGCSTLNSLLNTTVSQKTVAVAVQSFDAAETAAASYRALPDCTDTQTPKTAACKDRSIIATLDKDVKAGRAARDTLWAAVKANSDGATILDLYNAFESAISTINSDLNQ